jgi:enoyl-CoA hydratase/3-hydroxyacyl-CoA dehydrogenase
MSSDEGLGYDDLNHKLTDQGVLRIELDRPDRMNALTPGLLQDFGDLLESAALDEVRCVTVSGVGDTAFSAGADIEGLPQRTPAETMHVTGPLETINDYPRPVIAAIDGYCLGGGLELALACDLRVATTDAEFGAAEIQIGLIPGGGGTQRLVRLLGATRAKELVFRGNRISAKRAEEWGLINRAAPPDEFEAVLDRFVTDVAEGPPVALEVAKTVMNRGADASMETALTLESQGFGILFSTEDLQEGTDAFIHGRDPEYQGR